MGDGTSGAGRPGRVAGLVLGVALGVGVVLAGLRLSDSYQSGAATLLGLAAVALGLLLAARGGRATRPVGVGLLAVLLLVVLFLGGVAVLSGFVELS